MKTTMSEFEADLEPKTAWPRIRFNFGNGWSASLILRTGKDGMDANIASLAACPTGRWGKGATELGESEATADEAIAFLNEIRMRPLAA